MDTDMRYCRVCHKQKSAQHFVDFPEHNASGPKRTLAQIKSGPGAEGASIRAGASRSSATASAYTGVEAEEGSGVWGLAIAGFFGLAFLAVGIWRGMRG